MIYRQHSSGHLLADRRFAYAQDLAGDGDVDAATDLMRQALELAPLWSFGWSALGDLERRAGRLSAASEAYRAALRLDPADHAGAALSLAGLGLTPPPDQAPPAFVKSLFDQYAGQFDTHLVRTLGYVAPQHLRAAISQTCQKRQLPVTFSKALDLGCGTGLMGETLRRDVSWLEGVDLSAAMLEQAARKGIYDALHEADLIPYLATVAQSGYDLVTAADVFNYVGDLVRLLTGLAPCLRDGGMLAFSVEAGRDGTDVTVSVTRRFQHAPAYVADAVTRAGLDLEVVDEVVVRHDQGREVPGLVIVARKRHQPHVGNTKALHTLPGPRHDDILKATNEEEMACGSQTRLPS